MPLKGPLELRIIEIAWMQFEVVGVNPGLGELGTDDDFNPVTLRTRVKRKQGMIVETQLLQHA